MRLLFFLPLVLFSCGAESALTIKKGVEVETRKEENLNVDSSVIIKPVVVGAERIYTIIDSLKGKQVAVVSNQTGMIGKTHVVDSLISLGIDVKSVFSPEHGFRGDADAGAKVEDGKDAKTGLPIYSLYGKTKKPSNEQLRGIDVVIFDIQDVGVRFYTYISTLHYVMEACAENDIKVIVFDRPNPNAHYVDGPVLKPEFKSFVGMHPVPIVYGMTIGEYATMINGERWLKDSIQCELEIVKLENWTHNSTYELPIAPSPNLPNMQSIYLYPSLCLFEGTIMSIGRGTDFPFQVIGHPDYTSENMDTSFSFTPKSIVGKSSNPKLKGEKCYGVDLRNTSTTTIDRFTLNSLIEAYEATGKRKDFIDRLDFFNLLVGNDIVAKQLMGDVSAHEIESGWSEEVRVFKKVREKYLLYP